MKKKMMSLALALVMCMTLCVPALAEDSAAANSMPTTLTQQEQATRINLYNQAWFRSMRAPMYANYGPTIHIIRDLGKSPGMFTAKQTTRSIRWETPILQTLGAKLQPFITRSGITAGKSRLPVSFNPSSTMAI